MFFAFTPNAVEAQCINAFQFPSTINTLDQTTTLPITINTCNFTTEYSVVQVNFPGIYTFTITATPGYVTLTDALNNVIAHGPSPFQASIPGTGQYRVHWTSDSACGHIPGCHTTTAVFTNSFVCIPPLGVTAMGITATSANISWTASPSNPTNGYEYVITTTFGTPTGSGTPTTATSFTATTLTPNTQYFVYVRSMCASDTSLWNSTSFLTACVAVTAPWTEDFEDSTFALNNTFNPCWTPIPASAILSYSWWLETDQTGSFATGPSADHTTGVPGTGKYIYTEASWGLAGDQAEIRTPLIDISGITNPALRFWKHFYGSEIDSFFVEVDAGSGFQTIYATQGDGPQTAETDPWVEEVLDLNPFAGSTGIQIRFRAISAGCCSGDMALDDISIDVGPPCFKPSSISVVSIGVTDVTLDWVPSSGTSWEVAYGAPGFHPDSAVGSANGPIAILPASTHPFVVTGLTANTDYHFYVREACATVPGANSEWRGPASTRTNCTVFSSPFTENFDGSTWILGTSTGSIDPCWNRNGVPFDFSWMVDDDNTSGTNGPSQDHTTGSGQFITTESYGSAGDVAEITSPLVDLTGLTNPAVGFYFHMFGDEMDTLRIQVNDGTGWITLGTLGGQYQIAETDPWLYHEEPLTAYAGQTVQIRFSTTRPALCCDFDIAIDDFRIDEGSPCPIPGFPSISAISDSSLNVTWTDVSNVAWNVVWGLPGFHPDSAVGSVNGPIGTQTVFIIPNLDITGLSANTTYQVYVNAFCSAPGLTSYWSGPSNGVTDCGIEQAPWSYDFENGQWNHLFPYAADQCWGGAVAPTASGYRWQAEVDNTSSLATGPSADHSTGVPGSGTYVYIESSFTTPPSARLESPMIDLSGVASPAVAFYFHAYGAEINKTYIEVNDGNGWVILDSIVGQYQTSESDPWLYYEVSLLAYAGDTVQIGWNAQSIGFCCSGDFAIDDVFVGNGSPCPLPTQAGAFGATTTSIDLGWIGAGGTSWEVAYGTPGFNPDSAVGSPNGPIGIAGPFANDTATIVGLTPSTIYQFFVRENCGTPGVNSFWAGPAIGQTDCAPVAAPWSDSFESGLSHCWIQSNADQLDWVQHSGGTSSFNTGPSAANDGSQYIYVETSGSIAGYKALIQSPDVDITAITNPALILDYHMYGAGMGWFHVMVDSANTGNIDTLFAIYGDQGDQWNSLVLSLAGYEDPATGAVAAQFELTVDAQNGFAFENDLALDHVRIQQGPACFGPAFLTATSNSSSAASVSFNPVDTAATGWEIEYGPQGYTAGSGTVVSVTSPNATITGLSPGTCYDFRVREACASSAGSFSLWSAPATACTFIVPPYFESFTVIYDDAEWNEGSGLIGEPTVFSGSSSNWIDDGFGNAGFDGSAKVNIWTTSTDEWTFTPVIELSVFGQWQLEFDWTCREFGSPTLAGIWGPDDTVYVVISTDAGVTWNRSNALLMLDSTAIANADTNTIHEVIDISMYAGNNIQIGFYGESTVSNEDTDFFIDNVRISDPSFNPLACDDFESYNTGALAGQSANWLPWGGVFGTEDTEISTDQANNGTQSMKIYNGGANGVSDIVTSLGDFNAGMHQIDFHFYVPAGNAGYFNLMHFYHASGVGNTWAIETYLNGSTGTGELLRGSASINDTIQSFTFTTDAWHYAQIIVNLDADSAEFIMDTTSVAMWQWSAGLGGVYGSLGAFSAFSVTIDTLSALMYIDDFCYGAFNAPCVVTTMPTASGDTICEGTPATLTATTGSSTSFPVWTNQNGEVIGSGTPVTSDALYANTTFSVRDAELTGLQYHVGPTPDIASLGFANVPIGMFVTVMNDLRLDSVTLRSDGPMYVGVNLWTDDPNNGGVLMQTSRQINLPAAGDHQVLVDMVIPQGNYFLNMRYDSAATGTLFRATSGATYPYVIPDLVSLDSTNFQNQIRYYYLFDWVVNRVCMNGITVDVDVTIDAPPVAHFSVIQSGTGNSVVDLDASGSSSDAVTYDWDFGDGNTGSGVSVQHTYSNAGTYTIILTVTDDCGSTDVHTTDTVEVTIGLDESPLAATVNLFPNPTRDVFHLSFEVTEAQEVNIYVLNALGQVMYREALSNFSGVYSGTIDLSGEARGVYMVQIATKSNVVNRRVSLQ